MIDYHNEIPSSTLTVGRQRLSYIPFEGYWYTAKQWNKTKI